MSTTTVRSRNAMMAFKIETTPGTSSSPGTPDQFYGDFSFDYDPQIIDNGEFTGSLDAAPSIVGGLRPNIEIRLPLRGSGAAATAPVFDALMQCCGYTSTVTASAVGAPTAATAGTGNTATGAVAFAATANAYRGMPLFGTGSPVFNAAVLAYTSARVFTFTPQQTTPVSVSTLLQVPANVLYSPTSDETLYKNGSLHLFKDGWRWAFVGCSGTWSLEMRTGEPAFIVFRLRGMFESKLNSGVPATPLATVLPVAPRWVAGQCRLNELVARVSSLTLNAGIDVTMPPNPEAAEGFDAGVPILRRSGGNLDPLMDTNTSLDLFARFRSGAPMPLMAQIGSTAGNRFLATVPAARATGLRYAPRDGLEMNEIQFQADGANAGLFLCCY